MIDYLKHYKIELTAKSPVHVGSGKQWNKKEYILIPREKKVLMPDIEKLYGFLNQKHLAKEFEDYMLGKNGSSFLGKWLEEHNITLDDVYNCVKYELDCSDYLHKENRLTICEFQKDPYGLPYVPGTTLKGMLRTVLLSQKIRESQGFEHEVRKVLEETRQQGKANRKWYLAGPKADIEQKAFCTLNRKDECGKFIQKQNAVNDILSGLIVSDSQPLEWTDLTLCRKIDVNTQGEEHSLNIWRECIAPGAVIKFDLTIDATVCPYTINDIMKAIEDFSANYYEVFQSHFLNMERPSNNTVWLGGGTGFVSKTVVYSLLGYKKGLETTANIINATIHPKMVKEHKHFKDVYMGASPHIMKMTLYKGKQYCMGECEWQVVE